LCFHDRKLSAPGVSQQVASAFIAIFPGEARERVGRSGAVTHG
jgi:hypothetical protein